MSKYQFFAIDSESNPELNLTRVSFTIYDEMAQKGNSRRIVTNPTSLKPMLIKSAKARNWWHSATLQLRAMGAMSTNTPTKLLGDVRMTVHAYYASARSDLDCSVLRDVLQTRYTGTGKKRVPCLYGVIENDRQIKEEHYFHHIDAARPRAEVVIETLERP